jgi:AraC-like DNA-binding protein
MSATTPREMLEVSLRYQDLSATLARARLVCDDALTFMEIDTCAVRERLARASMWPSMKTVAADLNVSVRTLARRLEEEGTSFREIDDAARRARAEALLTETSQSLEQVAAAVGYATNSAFVRAFRRWHATPPGAWRRR